jgi:raffinose synthase
MGGGRARSPGAARPTENITEEAMKTFRLTDGVLAYNGRPILGGLDARLRLESDPRGVGGFLLADEPAKPRQRLAFPLGRIETLDRFLACHQDCPYWMLPAAGTAVGQVPKETQFLLARLQDGGCVLIVPLFSHDMRFALQGRDDALELVGETADGFTVSHGGLALFVAVAEDPYTLIPDAAASVIARLGTGRLRRDKPLPPFVETFGWCTWDAFYREVSAEKVRQGLESFRLVGVPPRFLILDDGWQSVRETPLGESRLTDFAANAKFPGGLRPLVDMARRDFGVENLLVWHAIMGYWGGVDGAALPGYDVRDTIARLPRTLAHYPATDWQGSVMGAPAPDAVGRFFDDYHAALQAQGVAGVKVDNQSALLYLSDRFGGRVAMFRAYREGLEQSAARHFNSTLINCMACTTEVWYHARTSNLNRSSTDFWPTRPETHGLHLATNAAVGMWFSEFMHPDWDMFQSGHPMGAFHAAGRAVSGAPIYVSDKPGAHNPELLRKLVCRDGAVLRCLDPGRPTPDCLFYDGSKEPVLLKIFNRNAHGWVVGVFNARYHAEEKDRTVLSGAVSPADVPGLEGREFVLYAHRAGKAVRVDRAGSLALSLPELDWEIVTLAPLQDGVAVIGLADKLNSGGAIQDLRHASHRVLFRVRDGGELVLYADCAPARVTLDGVSVSMTYDRTVRLVSCVLPDAGAVAVEWA